MRAWVAAVAAAGAASAPRTALRTPRALFASLRAPVGDSDGVLLGRATPDGTAAYARERRSDGVARLPIVRLPSSEWTATCVGLGTRGVTGDHVHRKAVKLALTTWCNVVETCAAWQRGDSERLVAECMHELVADGRLKRENVVLCSKIGVSSYHTTALHDRARLGNWAREVPWDWRTSLLASIEPDFLRVELDASLARLGVECIDVLYLFRPDASWNKMEEDKASYLQRLKRAFAFCEEQADKGVIQYYGIAGPDVLSTNGQPPALSLDELHELARSVSSTPRFRVFQYPLNLHDAAAALPRGRSLADVAVAHDMMRFTTMPINAATALGTLALRDFVEHGDGSELAHQVNADLNKAAHMERMYPELVKFAQEEVEKANGDIAAIKNARRATSSVIGASPAGGTGMSMPTKHGIDTLPAANAFQFSKMVFANLHTFRSIPEWDYGRQQIDTKLNAELHRVRRTQLLDSWCMQYGTVMHTLFDSVNKLIEHKAHTDSKNISSNLGRLDKHLLQLDSLQERALAVILSAATAAGESNSVTLVGMNKMKYVQHVLDELPRKPWRMSGEAAWRVLRATSGKCDQPHTFASGSS